MVRYNKDDRLQVSEARPKLGPATVALVDDYLIAFYLCRSGTRVDDKVDLAADAAPNACLLPLQSSL